MMNMTNTRDRILKFRRPNATRWSYTEFGDEILALTRQIAL